MTDHQPLSAIFHPGKSISAMTAARIQRYTLQLAAHDYDIVYKSSLKHANADGLSRLPLKMGKTSPDVVDILYMDHMETLPVTAATIKTGSSKDPVMSKVLKRIQQGWMTISPEGLQPFFIKRYELSVFHGFITWGTGVLVPQKLHSQTLQQLHDGHIGVVKVKGLACSHVWWPGIHKDIESLAKKCQGCQRVQFEAPTVPLHLLEWPAKPYQRIHVDYAGPFMGQMFLIEVDTHSKWPKVLRGTITRCVCKV